MNPSELSRRRFVASGLAALMVIAGCSDDRSSAPPTSLRPTIDDLVPLSRTLVANAQASTEYFKIRWLKDNQLTIEVFEGVIEWGNPSSGSATFGTTVAGPQFSVSWGSSAGLMIIPLSSSGPDPDESTRYLIELAVTQLSKLAAVVADNPVLLEQNGAEVVKPAAADDYFGGRTVVTYRYLGQVLVVDVESEVTLQYTAPVPDAVALMVQIDLTPTAWVADPVSERQGS